MKRQRPAGRKGPKCVLITGMSGTGKPAVIAELARRGRHAIDLDTPEWSHWVDAPGDDLTPRKDQDWVWREYRVHSLLSAERESALFVSGTAENMAALFDLIDMIVLLSAPVDTIMARLGERSGDGHGQTEDERGKVATLIATVEPLIRLSADYEIDTRQPVSRTADRILTIAG